MLFRDFGPPSALELVADQPLPSRSKGEILVEVACTSVNPVDCKIRAGVEVPHFMAARPKASGRGSAHNACAAGGGRGAASYAAAGATGW